ncbi:hypothetical protein BOO69_19335 (plasmid) [Sulfitobacter alexandrii]|uniref:B12-binding domain-containing protein n=1 Tax=Sulfitobacter alexandrii TaxID=1917485 RepID=A0A1J0WMX7_9RHOB|nr:cobalamin B12-binding domain-containing protein [Sulfitobacter alexandrii]APE45708.1 hypothetical protein BOO69_19335 [Sulfitobacter alexandrii]
MASMENDRELVEVDLYQQSFEDIRLFKQTLPETTVVSLAREVLRRLAQQTPRRAFDRADIDSFGAALVEGSSAHAYQMVEKHHAKGASVQDIYLGLLSPAAKLLGEKWVSDELTFAEVTIGTGRIYAIMRSLRFTLEPGDLPPSKSAFFASVPDETHTLGVKMAADLFRQKGWHIDVEAGLDHDALLERIIASRQRLVGISAGGQHALPALARLILALRVSVPGVRILVSGNIVDEARDSIRLMQVDAMTSDLKEAIAEMERLWGNLTAVAV